jgi:hypothetical protein
MVQLRVCWFFLYKWATVGSAGYCVAAIDLQGSRRTDIFSETATTGGGLMHKSWYIQSNNLKPWLLYVHRWGLPSDRGGGTLTRTETEYLSMYCKYSHTYIVQIFFHRLEFKDYFLRLLSLPVYCFFKSILWWMSFLTYDISDECFLICFALEWHLSLSF